MHDPNDYSIVCARRLIDGEHTFEARVLELPDVIGYGNTRSAAERVALDAIAGLQDLAKAHDRAFPEPLTPLNDYSGRITLRLSRTSHREAAIRANAEGVSLNSLLSEAISTWLAGAKAIQITAGAPSGFRDCVGISNKWYPGWAGTHAIASDEVHAPDEYYKLLFHIHSDAPRNLVVGTFSQGASEVRKARMFLK